MELQLRNSILRHQPDADTSILNKLVELVNKYNLKWVPSDKYGDNVGGAWFIMSELSTAKGLDSEDYIKNWASLTTSFKEVSSESLAGKGSKISGEILARFKNQYKDTYGKSLGRINSLWIGNWLHAYSYLVQGVSNTAKDFQELGSSAVENGVKGAINATRNTIITEEQLQECIMLLSSYSTINLRFEVGVKNTFESNALYRRWDFVEVLPKVVKIYELKRATITENDIKDKLNKNYIELAAQKYPGKIIHFIFVSNAGISWEAKDYIEEISNNGFVALYPCIRSKILFEDLQQITNRLINNIVKINPEGYTPWLLNIIKADRFKEVVSKRTIGKLEQYKLTAA